MPVFLGVYVEGERRVVRPGETERDGEGSSVYIQVVRAVKIQCSQAPRGFWCVRAVLCPRESSNARSRGRPLVASLLRLRLVGREARARVNDNAESRSDSFARSTTVHGRFTAPYPWSCYGERAVTLPNRSKHQRAAGTRFSPTRAESQPGALDRVLYFRTSIGTDRNGADGAKSAAERLEQHRRRS